MNKKSTVDRLWAKVNKGESEGGCWLWTAGKRDGYGRFSVEGRVLSAHRFARELLVGPIPEGLCCLHKCDTPACVNPDHLFLGTREDNMADRAAKGRGARGENHGRAKLTEAQVLEIRTVYALGSICQRQIGWWYGVAQATIADVLRGDTWVRE